MELNKEKVAIDESNFKQVQPEFRKSKEAFAAVQPKAISIVALEKMASGNVQRLRDDMQALLVEMNALKDKISRFYRCLGFCYQKKRVSIA